MPLSVLAAPVQIKHAQDEEKRRLCSLREQLRPVVQPELKEVRPSSVSRVGPSGISGLSGAPEGGQGASAVISDDDVVTQPQGGEVAASWNRFRGF